MSTWNDNPNDYEHALAEFARLHELRAEIARLRAALENRIQCCTKLQMTNDRLRAALEPFARNVDALSLSRALGHIEREHLWAARKALAEQDGK